MAGPSRTISPSVTYAEVESRLREEPFTFEFFQAIRLLERMLPDREPLGGFGHPSEEVARIAAHPSLSFPASQIQSLVWEENKAPLMKVNFMGLTGVNGPLPQWYTALVMEQARSGSTSLRDFLDIFNHRSISLFYRAWQKYRFDVAYERGERSNFFQYLLSMIGLGSANLMDRQTVADEAMVFYSGLLAPHQRSAKGLEQLLGDYFSVPVQVQPLVGAWYPLDEATQCCLDGSESASQQLGGGAVIGDEAWDRHSRVGIVIGPLSFAEYQEFLPDGSAYEPLRSLTKFYSNEEFQFEVKLVLHRQQVPGCQIGDDPARGIQLGWSSWLKSERTKLDRDPGDTILEI